MKKSLLFLFILCFGTANAGNENWHLGARSAGMAHSSVTLFDTWSTHHNQAGLGWLKNPTAGIFFENRFLLSEFSHMGAAFTYPVKNASFGLSYAGFGYSQYKTSKIGLAYGMKFNDKVTGGVQVNYHTLRLGGTYGSASNVSFELGLQAKVTEDLTIAMHLFNPTKTKLNEYYDERIPTVMRFGAGYRFSEKVLLTAEAEKDIDYDAMFRAGLEYHPSDILFIRAGVATNPGLFSFGFGLQFDNFKVDLASTYHQVIGFSPQVSLNYNFSKTEK